MKNNIFLSFLIFSFLSCKKSDQSTNNTAHSQQIENTKNCYLTSSGRDSLKISFINYNGNITGELDYRNIETDGSMGTFTGKKYGDTLKLKARTIAEGYISYNDMYLIEKEGKLYNGVGEILKVNDSTTRFANPSKIDYTRSYIFNKIDCQ